MNKAYRQVEKLILKQMDKEEALLMVSPLLAPLNRHQRRAAEKAKK